MRFVIGWIAVAFVLSSCTPPAPVEKTVDASESVDLGAEFIGSWSLGSFTRKGDDGEAVYPMGEDAFGRIVYADNGKMTVVLMASGGASREDEGFFAYSAGYVVDADAGTVTHHVEACNAPEWIGTDRVRAFELVDADTLALRPLEGDSELVWHRER